MSDFLPRARQIFNLPDEDIIEGHDQIRQQQPEASDDDVLSHMVNYAKQVQPEVLKQALEPARSEQEVQSLYDIAEERARARRLKALPGDIISGIGGTLMGRPEMGGQLIEKRQKETRAEEISKVRDLLERSKQRRQDAGQKFKLARGVEELGIAKEEKQKKEEAIANENDPNSAESKQFQALVKQVIGKDYNNSAAELKKVFPQLIKVYNKQLDLVFKNKQLQEKRTQQQTIRGEKVKKEEQRIGEKQLSQFDKFKMQNKDSQKKMETISGIKGLLEQGDWSNAANELSKTMMVRMAGDPRPSDADIARINPNPGFKEGVYRIWQKKINNKPFEMDRDELMILTQILEDKIYEEFYNKAQGFAKARASRVKLDPKEMATLVLQDLGMQNVDFSKYEAKAKGKTIVKKLRNKRTGQIKIVYSDGTSEIKDGQ